MYLCDCKRRICQLKINKSMEISHILQSWYEENRRDLPWRETRDAYRIWLSEVILQQTRVAQGYDYYMRFVERYPTVGALANATEDDVLKLWQGLGYYSRARNLHKAARQVVEQCGGRFPTSYAELIRLAGIGPYTAAAIASFSANEPVAVVDGNVYRVLARLFDVATPIDSTAGQREFGALADALIDRDHAGRHNQAMMEFGALHCTPTSPRCAECPLATKCMALAAGTVGERPVKAGRVKVRERHLHYYLMKRGREILVHQRGADDIWRGLWEFPVMEEGAEGLAPLATITTITLDAPPLFTLRHQLTHQTLTCDFHMVEVDGIVANVPAGYEWLSWEDWQKKAVAKPIFMANERFSTLF